MRQESTMKMVANLIAKKDAEHEDKLKALDVALRAIMLERNVFQEACKLANSIIGVSAEGRSLENWNHIFRSLPFRKDDSWPLPPVSIAENITALNLATDADL